MRKKQVFGEARCAALPGHREIDLQGEAGQPGKRLPSLGGEGERHQRRTRLDHPQVELACEPESPVGGADLRNRQAAGGHHQRGAADLAGIGLQGKPRAQAGIGRGIGHAGRIG